MKPKSTLATSFLFLGGLEFHKGVDYIDNDVHTAGVTSSGICPYMNGPRSYHL